MAFPQTPLPLQVDISLDGTTWTDISSDVRAEQKIRITRGRADWGQQVDFGRCSLALSNTDGTYSPRNPEGTYYGQIGRNTPVRVSVNTGSVALDLPGGVGDYATTPDHADLDITGDIDIRFDATLLNWAQAEYPETGQTDYPYTELIGKDATGDRSWALYTRLGRLRFEWRASGGGTGTVTSAVLPLTTSGRLAVRVTMDVDDGSSQHVITFYTSDSISGTWTQLGNATTGSGTTDIRAGTAALRIGDIASAESAWHHPAIGQVHAAQVRSGIGGTIVANPDFTAQADGATSFADSAGRTWSLAGNTEITNRKVRFVGEVASWTPRWDTGGLDVITEVEAAGVMRRLSQGVVPVKSPAYRAYTNETATNVVAYWPMEDAGNATELASAFEGHPSMTFTDTVTPAAYEDWVGSDALPTVTTGELQVTVPTYTLNSVNRSSILMFFKVPAAGVVSTQRLLWLSQSGTATYWDIQVNTSGNLNIRAFDNEGVNILDTGFGSDSVNGLEKVLIFSLAQSGGSVAYSLTVYDIADSLDTAVPDDTLSSFTISGTLGSRITGRVTKVRLCRDGAMNGTAIGHLVLGNDISSFTATAGALVGWNAETAAARIARLGREEDLHAYPTRVGDEQCGVQARSTALDLMRTAETVDEGILAEQRSILGIRHINRASLYNQTAALTLDYTGTDGLVVPLDPVDDDQSVTNDVTVVRDGGSSARLTLDTGTLSTQNPPDGIGLYDTSHTLNLLDDTQPLHHAGWQLHLGTWDETRFPQVTVNLASAPASIAGAAAVDVGSRIQITNPPAWLPPDTLDLLVQGYSETLDQFTWTLTFNCTPFGPFNVATEGDSLYNRADTAGCELAEALTTSEADVDVLTTSGPVWVTANPVLTANPDFETDLTGWNADGSTISRVATPDKRSFSGDWSLQMTPDGVAEFPNAGSDHVAAVVGQSYVGSGWLRCATSRLVSLSVNWFDVSDVYLSTDSDDISVTADEWTWFEVTATAPASTAFANIAPTLGSTPPSTDVLLADEVTLRLAGGTPQEFPFDTRAGGEVMEVTACTSACKDVFGRTETDTWGDADIGGTWTNVGGVAGNFDVAGGVGTHTLTSVDVSRRSLLTAPHADFDIYCDIATSALATGASLTGAVMARYLDIDNMYMARLEFTTSNTIVLAIRKRLAASESVLGTYTTRLTHVAGTYVRVRFQGSGTALKARAWQVGALEPGLWDVEVTDSSLTAAGSIGCRSVSVTGNTNVNPIVSYDNFDLVNPQTMTVTRSVNGVTKTHASGTDVRLAYPAYTAL